MHVCRLNPLRWFPLYEPAGDQPKAIAQLAKNIESGSVMKRCWVLRVRVKTYTMAKLSRRYKTNTRFSAQQNTCCSIGSGAFKRVFPEQCGGIFRILLRLLSARSLCSNN